MAHATCASPRRNARQHSEGVRESQVGELQRFGWGLSTDLNGIAYPPRAFRNVAKGKAIHGGSRASTPIPTVRLWRHDLLALLVSHRAHEAGHQLLQVLQ